MTLSVEIDVSAIHAEGWAGNVHVSSDPTRDWAVIISIGEEMAKVRARDLIDAINRAALK